MLSPQRRALYMVCNKVDLLLSYTYTVRRIDKAHASFDFKRRQESLIGNFANWLSLSYDLKVKMSLLCRSYPCYSDSNPNNNSSNSSNNSNNNNNSKNKHSSITSDLYTSSSPCVHYEEESVRATLSRTSSYVAPAEAKLEIKRVKGLLNASNRQVGRSSELGTWYLLERTLFRLYW